MVEIGQGDNADEELLSSAQRLQVDIDSHLNPDVDSPDRTAAKSDRIHGSALLQLTRAPGNKLGKKKATLII